MKIRITDARAIVEALTTGIDDAMAHGKHEFDLTATVQSIDDVARDELQRAIEAAKSHSG